MTEHESSNRQSERASIHERAADPADTANRPLEPRSSAEPLHETDTPHLSDQDPHHRLNTHVGDVDPTTDSDPYRVETPEDDSDRASGVLGEGERPDE
jgi:hypothetical protein